MAVAVVNRLKIVHVEKQQRHQNRLFGGSAVLFHQVLLVEESRKRIDAGLFYQQVFFVNLRLTLLGNVR
ncbi:hypothetical protein SDC9_100982 [bioreactor metagenome]|uniref:Uncharacterized protein n=1 Tax=bioreactor metagenome TaxID=1076179 RepID=A0A645AN69_9ZZZZ